MAESYPTFLAGNRVTAGLLRSVTVAGGDDIEPGWRGPAATRAWIRGYRSVTRTPYYDFGGAAGCPPIGWCQGHWRMEDVWYAAWVSGLARPLLADWVGR